MRKQIVISLLALLFGLVILSISVMTSVTDTNTPQARQTNKRFYWGEPIKPDHSLYWLKVIKDQVALLVVTSGEDKIKLKLEYAQERADAAHELVLQDRSKLAINTYQKAIGYLIEASNDLEDVQQSSDLSRQLELQVAAVIDQIEIDKHLLTDNERVFLDESLQSLETVTPSPRPSASPFETE